MQDPNPLVAGQGLELLTAAGVETGVGLLEQDAERINPGFFKRMRTGMPFVRCKLAMSLDGRTAMASGASKWITSPAARNDVQLLRAGSSAVLTGIGTVLADDPSLNVRVDPVQPAGAADAADLRQPLRVVLDTRLRMPPRARMLSLPGRTLIICGQGAPAEIEQELSRAGAEILRLPQLGGRLDPTSVMQALARLGMNEVLIESGATLAGQALRAGVVDELVVYVAPHLMGHEGRALVDLPGLDQMEDRLRLAFVDARAVGSDIRLTLRPEVMA